MAPRCWPSCGAARSRSEHGAMSRVASLLALAIVLALVPPAAADAPAGHVTWAAHITLAPTWFDPAETPGIGTPFMILYALHDALVKPMPGNPMAPSLAESWSLSNDGLIYVFVLRQGAKFHNSDPVTAEDVKISFERERADAAKLSHYAVPGREARAPAGGRRRLPEA